MSTPQRVILYGRFHLAFSQITLEMENTCSVSSKGDMYYCVILKKYRTFVKIVFNPLHYQK